MSEPVLIPPGGGEIVGDSHERRVEILSDDDSLHATWSRFGPRREGAGPHVHRRHTDLFYVLEGELTIGLGVEDEPAVVPAGTLARVPPPVVHGFRNGSDADVRYLNLHAPGRRFAEFMRALREGRDFTYDQYPPPPDGGRPLADAVVGGEEVVANVAGRRVALLADVEEIAIAEALSEPGAPPESPHVHGRHVESFFVLEGELTLTSAGRELRAQKGSWVQIPPGVPHALAVPASGPARYLDVHTPSCGFGAFLRRAERSGSSAQPAAFDQEPA